MPFNGFGSRTDLQTITKERKNDCAVITALETGKLPGRLNPPGRAVPSSHSNVISGDAQGDVITDGTYIYTLISISGSLVWDRRAYSVGW